MGLGLRDGMLATHSIGEIMSRTVEMTANDARPLVKVYTKARLRKLFSGFERISITQHQMVVAEVPSALSWVPLSWLGRIAGWNLVIKAFKPNSGA